MGFGWRVYSGGKEWEGGKWKGDVVVAVVVVGGGFGDGEVWYDGFDDDWEAVNLLVVVVGDVREDKSVGWRAIHSGAWKNGGLGWWGYGEIGGGSISVKDDTEYIRYGTISRSRNAIRVQSLGSPEYTRQWLSVVDKVYT